MARALHECYKESLHPACASSLQVKGNLICDICKTPIHNLPPIDPEILAAREAARRRREPNFSVRPMCLWLFRLVFFGSCMQQPTHVSECPWQCVSW